MKSIRIGEYISLFIAVFVTVIVLVMTPVQEVYAANQCNAKRCTVDGKSCVCCLQVDGSVECVGCGTTDCEDSDPGTSG